MANITFSQGANIGGVSQVLMAYSYELSSINPVSFKPGRDWSVMDFLPDSSSVKESSSAGDNGPEHSYSLVFSFNKQAQAMYDAFKRYLGQVGVTRYTDNNGVTRLLGRLDNPVTVKTESDTGNDPTDMNFFKITITWTNNEPAPVI
ncbi:hypothetical protein [Mucilaginibacter sp. CSA2-8R]|uniref:hypothetical protein n=1 Tax=Mucilaginibacter sp. CSA2-8R TaxID=3141542 RepID=UPI00315C5508